MPEPHDEDLTPEAPQLERQAMAWPPAEWERALSAWRDDAWGTGDAFTPYDATLVAGDEDFGGLTAPTARPSHRAFVREVVETIVLTGVIFLGIRLLVQNFRIEGRSMEPTLHSGQYLLVNKIAYRGLGEPRRGDIVVFEAWGQEKDFIKRVVGTAGDTVEIHDGSVFINGTKLEEDYLDQSTTDAIGPVTLGEDQLYVLGDNRGNSSDSRAYGPLPREKVVGKAWLTYWPPNEIGLVPSADQGYASTP
jgi:signal peptidase I